jgi:hypothetical protein
MALAREESSPLFAGNAAGTLRLIFYLALAMVLMVLDHRNGWLWRMRYARPSWSSRSIAGRPAAEGMRTRAWLSPIASMLTEQNQRLREDLLLANAKLNRMAGGRAAEPAPERIARHPAQPRAQCAAGARDRRRSGCLQLSHDDQPRRARWRQAGPAGDRCAWRDGAGQGSAADHIGGDAGDRSRTPFRW